MIAPSNAAYPHRAILLRDNSARIQPGKFSDRALIAAIACGDQQAMRRLYDRHSANVYRFARRLGLDRSAAEDLVSEVFLEVWRHARAFEGRAQVSTWLLAITRYRGLDMIRRIPLEPLDEIEHIRDDADGPEALVQKRQAASVLAEALHHLSPAHREIIDLVYYHERSIDEVAGILNIPSGTVKTCMFYARTRLAKLLRRGGRDAPQLLA